MRRDVGVTLFEMLVAVALCALIGMAGSTMLDTMPRAHGRAEADLDRIAALDRAFAVLGRDLLVAPATGLALRESALSVPGDPPRTWRFTDGALPRGIGEDLPVQTFVTRLAAARLRILSAGGSGPPAGRPRWMQVRPARSNSA